MDIYIVISTFETITHVISKMWTCPNTSKRLLRRIAPPHSLRRLDPRPIWSQFSLKITHSYLKKKKKKGSSRPEWTQDKSYSFSSQLQKPDYLRLSCGYFQIVSCGWLLGASAQTKRQAGEDLRLSFSFVGMQQINVGIKIPQLLLFITLTSARLILILTVSTKT